MKQCDNGHFFDEARHDSCPYCKPAGLQIGKTMAAKPMNKTAPLQQAGAQEADRGKTVGIIKKKIGIDPVVGFAVCISGPQRGADFKLVSGRNFIGRAASMDVSLSDDDAVSRENHALISYDPKNNHFMLSPGVGRGITYCNEKQVEVAVQLAAYDVIEVGASRLIFLPLCGERFRWEE